jgi:hypothetical protein
VDSAEPIELDDGACCTPYLVWLGSVIRAPAQAPAPAISVMELVEEMEFSFHQLIFFRSRYKVLVPLHTSTAINLILSINKMI